MKKLFSIFLILTLLLSFLVACGGNKSPSEGDTQTNETTTSSVGETTDNHLLADRDCKGYIFRWLAGANTAGIVVDEGETVDETSIAYQASVERDAEITDRMNVKFADIQSGVYAQISSYVIKDSLNPESSFDVGNVAGPENASELITNNVIFDALDVPHLQLDMDWYQQQANKEYKILDKQYFVAGAFPSFPSTPPFYFNKNMLSDLNLELPYDMIKNGSWTIEELMKYTSGGYSDTNSAIQGPDKNDTFGYAGHPNSVAYFYQGMGGPTTTRNDRGEVVPVFSNDTIDAIYSKVEEFYNHPANYTKDTNAKSSHESFYNGNAMFCYWVTSLLDPNEIESFERGLAILPKYDLDQESYYCPSVGGIKLFPTNIGDIELIGYIYEALCEATLRIVYPATIQEAVDFEQLTDEGSIEVQHIVDRSLMFDILKNCDPSGSLGSCGYIMSCFNNNTTPSAMAPMVKGVYEKVFADFFSKVQK